jgi:signal transduction histidine kinase
VSPGRFLAAYRTPLADTALVLALGAASFVGGANAFMTGPATTKLILAFGSAAAWHRAVLVWWLLAALCATGLLIRNRWPVAALVVAFVGAGGHLLDPRLPLLPLDLAAPIALYTLTVQARTRWARWVALGATSAFAYLATAAGEFLADGQVAGHGSRDLTAILGASAGKAVLSTVLILVVAFALGTASRNRRAHLALLEQRAADLERERDQRTALAIAAERARITRELHDVVAHGLSVMVVQAQGGAAALRRHPERTAAALQDIVTTGRASLAEMRRLLGLARREPDQGAHLAPQPGIGALPALVDQVRAAGTPVHLDVDGEPVPLPAGVDLSAYRIVQEALTNTLKHAGPGARVAIRLGFTPDRLEIEVSDDGLGGTAPSTVDSGNGLRGIAERVGMLGGELAAGPCPGRGFRVRALLPLHAGPPPPGLPAPAPPAPAPASAIPTEASP